MRLFGEVLPAAETDLQPGFRQTREHLQRIAQPVRNLQFRQQIVDQNLLARGQCPAANAAESADGAPGLLAALFAAPIT